MSGGTAFEIIPNTNVKGEMETGILNCSSIRVEI